MKGKFILTIERQCMYNLSRDLLNNISITKTEDSAPDYTEW